MLRYGRIFGMTYSLVLVVSPVFAEAEKVPVTPPTQQAATNPPAAVPGGSGYPGAAVPPAVPVPLDVPRKPGEKYPLIGEEAGEIAQKLVKDGFILDVEREFYKGKRVYCVEMKAPDGYHEIFIRPEDGKVLHHGITKIPKTEDEKVKKP